MAASSDEEDLRQFIQHALLLKSAGTSTALYDRLVATVQGLKGALRGPSTDPDAPDKLALLLRALTRCLSSVHERAHERLLTELLDVPLWAAPPAARAALLDFFTHAVVASGALVQSCLHTLVYSLLPPPGRAEPDPAPGRAWAPAPGHVAAQDDVLAAAERVLQLVPTAASRLLPLLAANLPHKLRDRNAHCLYLRALFRLAEAPAGAGLREGVLSAVVDHLINVDVEIKWEDIVEEPTEEAKEEEGGAPPAGDEEPDIFELEGMSEAEAATGARDAAAGQAMPRGGWEGGHARPAVADDAAALAAAAPPPVDETADKLDSLMELTLGHLARRVAAGQLPAAWETAMAAFERTVLHTHRSKFTQFLVFYLAHQAPAPCSRSLLHLLLGRLMDRQQPPITRSACAAYAASFLARAAYIPEPLVVEALQRLADWCSRYAREDERRGGPPPVPASAAPLGPDAQARHAAFYAACQALLYVLCYHMGPLLLRTDRAAAAGRPPGPPAFLANGPTARGPAAQQNGAGAGGTGATSAEQQQPAIPQGLDRQQPAQGPPRAPPPQQAGVERERELAACAEAMRRLLTQEMPLLLSHPLDPLSSCAASVVAEFGRQVRALGFPALARLVLAWERRAAGGGGPCAKQARPLEVFFPFDPYLLRRSAGPLALGQTYVRWQSGHPAGAARAGLDGGSDAGADDDEDDDLDDAMSDGEDLAGGEGVDADSSGLDTSSSSEDASDESLEESDDESTSSEDTDDLRRTRFGSMPGSSLSSGGRRRGGAPRRRRVPGALKVSLAHGGGSASPTLGVPIPHGSISTDNSSPWGMSPANGLYGASFAAMSCTPGR